MTTTKIEWTDRVWNPVRGCRRVSEGCRNCYAERMAARFSGPGMPYDGLVFRASDKRSPGWTGEARFFPEMLSAPLHWRKPCRIFVNSMSDLFHEDVTNEQIAAIFGVMAACPQHTFQILTKRPKRMLKWFEWIRNSSANLEEVVGEICPDDSNLEASFSAMVANSTVEVPIRSFTAGCHRMWPLTNVHLGVSVENQKTSNERIPLLLQCPAAVRWVSCEPLLGAVNIRDALGLWNGKRSDGYCVACRTHGDFNHTGICECRKLDWVVCGGESGPDARPMHPTWAMSLRDQCREAGVPFFFKQWGEWLPRSACFHTLEDGRDLAAIDPESKRWSCIRLTDEGTDGWQLGSKGESAYMQRVGKKMAGDILQVKRYQMFPGDKWA